MAKLMTNLANNLYKIPGNSQEYTIGAQADVTKLVPVLAVTKSPDGITVEKDDTIQYTLEIENKGDIPFTRIDVQDTLAAGLKYVENSIIVPVGYEVAGTNIEAGVSVKGVLAPQGKVQVKFSAKVLDIVPPDRITNQGVVTGWFKLDSDLKERTVPAIAEITNVPSNVVAAICIKPGFTMIKTVNPGAGQKDDMLTYTITINNTGNVDLNKFALTDVVPPELAYQKGSLKGTLDGIGPVTLQDDTLGTTGVVIGTIPAGKQYVVSFDTKVVSSDALTIVTNTAVAKGTYIKDGYGEKNIGPKDATIPVTIYNVDPYVSLQKVADKQFVQVGDLVTYTLTFTNSSAVALTSVTIEDVIPTGMRLYEGVTSKNVGAVPVDGVATLSFTVQVVSIPPTIFVNDQAKATYTYLEPETDITRGGQVTALPVVINGGKVDLVKTLTPSMGVVGDILLCTITVISTSASQSNKILEDLSAAPDLEIVAENNHIFIDSNDTGVDATTLLTGYDIGQIEEGESKQVTFKVRIK